MPCNPSREAGFLLVRPTNKTKGAKADAHVVRQDELCICLCTFCLVRRFESDSDQQKSASLEAHERNWQRSQQTQLDRQAKVLTPPGLKGQGAGQLQLQGPCKLKVSMTGVPMAMPDGTADCKQHC